MITSIFEAIDRDLAQVEAWFHGHPGDVTRASSHGITPIGYAAYNGKPEVVTFLLNQGAELTVFAAVALGLQQHVASAVARDPGLVRTEDPCVNWHPLLYLAAVNDQLQIAELLLEAGADLSQGHRGITPLHGAAELGHLSMVQWCLAQGADVNARGDFGMTPLHLAAYRGHDDIATMLLTAGADPDARTRDGDTPADMARFARVRTENRGAG